jgi:hypothetical protein
MTFDSEIHWDGEQLTVWAATQEMSRSLLNIEKRSLPWLTLRGAGLASKDIVG